MINFYLTACGVLRQQSLSGLEAWQQLSQEIHQHQLWCGVWCTAQEKAQHRGKTAFSAAQRHLSKTKWSTCAAFGELAPGMEEGKASPWPLRLLCYVQSAYASHRVFFWRLSKSFPNICLLQVTSPGMSVLCSVWQLLLGPSALRLGLTHQWRLDGLGEETKGLFLPWFSSWLLQWFEVGLQNTPTW